MEDNQTTTELQTEPPEAETESTSLPDDTENLVGEIKYSTIQMADQLEVYIFTERDSYG